MALVEGLPAHVAVGRVASQVVGLHGEAPWSAGRHGLGAADGQVLAMGLLVLRRGS